MSKTFVKGTLKHDFYSASMGLVTGVYVLDAFTTGGAILGSTLAYKACGYTVAFASGLFAARGLAYGLHGVGIDEDDISVTTECEIICACGKPDCCVGDEVITPQAVVKFK